MLRLAGFEPVRPTPDNPDFDTIARDDLAKVLAKTAPGTIGFIPLSSRPDRWGRIPVFAFPPGRGGRGRTIARRAAADTGIWTFHARARSVSLPGGFSCC